MIVYYRSPLGSYGFKDGRYTAVICVPSFIVIPTDGIPKGFLETTVDVPSVIRKLSAIKGQGPMVSTLVKFGERFKL
jgi:hypothetical protein